MPIRTRKKDGSWVTDPIKPAKTSRSSAPAQAQVNPQVAQLLAQVDKLTRQKTSLVSTLSSVGSCKNITQVRKCLEHGRQTYPTK